MVHLQWMICHSNQLMSLYYIKEILEKDIPKCRTFNNLRSLEFMQWDISYDLGLVAYFLKHSPCLRILTLHLNHVISFTVL
jgi:hypothetical protein